MMSDLDHPDSLEGWVSVKKQPFLPVTDIKKLTWLVNWNDVHKKIAITCREKPRTVSDTEQLGHSEDFTFRELRCIHDQLCLIHPSLTQYLPDLPLEPTGVWAYFYNTPEFNESICAALVDYLKIAHDICGYDLLIDAFFSEQSYDDYFEEVGELKKRKYTRAIFSAEEELGSTNFIREGSINMLDMTEVYKHQDEAMYKWNIALADYYNYLIQPFIDEREFSRGKLREAKYELSNPNIGAKRKTEFANMFAEWNQNHLHALEQLEKHYMDYYKETVKKWTEIEKQMLDDQKKFGKTTFNKHALPRLERIQEDLYLEKIQLLQHKRMHLENQLNVTKQQIAGVEEKPEGVKAELVALEQKTYQLQKQLKDAKDRVLAEELKLFQLQKSQRYRQLGGGGEEIFYDAAEAPGDVVVPDIRTDQKIKDISQKIAQISKRMAKSRTTQVIAKSNKEEKQEEEAKDTSHFNVHHSIQVKREERKVEEETKKDFYEEERKKTLARLRQYKQKFHPRNNIRPRVQKPRPASGRSGDGDATDSVRDAHSPGPRDTHSPGPMSMIHHVISHDVAPPPSLPVVPSTPIPPPPSTAPPPPPTAPPPPPTAPPPPPPPPPPPSLSLVSPGDAPGLALGDIHSVKLKPAGKNTSSTRPSSDPMADMMAMIRTGVKLRPAPDKSEDTQPPSFGHIEQISAVLSRIDRHIHPPDEPSDDDDVTDEFED